MTEETYARATAILKEIDGLKLAETYRDVETKVTVEHGKMFQTVLPESLNKKVHALIANHVFLLNQEFKSL